MIIPDPCECQPIFRKTFQAKNQARLHVNGNRRAKAHHKVYLMQMHFRAPQNVVMSVVRDVHLYKEFIPWIAESTFCKDGEINIDSKEAKVALLTLKFMGITIKYYSIITENGNEINVYKILF